MNIVEESSVGESIFRKVWWKQAAILKFHPKTGLLHKLFPVNWQATLFNNSQKLPYSI